MSAPVTLAVLLCPLCKNVWSPARATFRWPLSTGGGRMPELIGYDCPNGCGLDAEAGITGPPPLSGVSNRQEL